MEVLLNLFWLLVTLAGFVLWRTRWSLDESGSRRRPRSVRSALGLGCALVLLFFPISLTDDLYLIPAVAEETGFTRRAQQSWRGGQACSDPDKQAPHFAAAILPGPPLLFTVVVGRLIPLAVPSPRTHSERPSQGRAPPVSLL